MKRATWLILAASSVLAPFTLTAEDQLRTNRIEFDPAITGYVRFLEQQHPLPVDYILGLFEKYDLVVICERAHAEVTQYDLIYSFVCDPRFQKQVKNIFTEVGTCALRPVVEDLLTDATLTDPLFLWGNAICALDTSFTTERVFRVVASTSRLAASSGGSTLTTTCRPSPVSSAMNTRLMAPPPSSRTST